MAKANALQAAAALKSAEAQVVQARASLNQAEVNLGHTIIYTTVIDVPNPAMKLKPGMTATVTVEVARQDDVVRVPNAALRFQPTEELYLALGQAAPASVAVGPGGGASQSARVRPAGPVLG